MRTDASQSHVASQDNCVINQPRYHLLKTTGKPKKEKEEKRKKRKKKEVFTLSSMFTMAESVMFSTWSILPCLGSVSTNQIAATGCFWQLFHLSNPKKSESCEVRGREKSGLFDRLSK